MVYWNPQVDMDLPYKYQHRKYNKSTEQVKNPNWQVAEQRAMCITPDKELNPETTWLKSS